MANFGHEAAPQSTLDTGSPQLIGLRIGVLRMMPPSIARLRSVSVPKRPHEYFAVDYYSSFGLREFFRAVGSRCASILRRNAQSDSITETRSVQRDFVSGPRRSQPSRRFPERINRNLRDIR